jgi:PII-like signaling protein
VSAGRHEGSELRFYFGERDRDGDGPLDVAVMDACARSGVWAAALLRGVEGFGRSAIERTDRLLSLSEDAPLVAVAVGERDVIERLADEVKGLAVEGLVVLEAAALAPTGTPTAIAAGVGVPVGGSPGDGGRDLVRATVWGPRSGSGSPHLRAVDAMHRHGADCATVLLGVDGVLDGERRRARFVAGNQGVPAMTVAVGERGAIDAALAQLGAVATLVTIEGVERNSVIDRGKLHGAGGVERNRPYEAESLHGGARVTLVTSEIAQGGGHPLYLELVHSLRRGGAAGATALRGVWGFRGGVAPHGDRVLALRRDVPLIVETVDSAERAAEWLEVAESLAGEADVVCSQSGLRILTLG